MLLEYTSSLFGSCVLYSLSEHIAHDCALPNTVHYPLLHYSLLHYPLLHYILLCITHYCITHFCTLLNTALLYRPDWTPQEAAQMQGPQYEEVDPHDLGEAAHFCRFAFAAYGYMLYIWSRPQMV